MPSRARFNPQATAGRTSHPPANVRNEHAFAELIDDHIGLVSAFPTEAGRGYGAHAVLAHVAERHRVGAFAGHWEAVTDGDFGAIRGRPRARTANVSIC